MIEKGLYAAPEGLDSLGNDEQGIEIEIVDPEEVNIHMGKTIFTRIFDLSFAFGNNFLSDLIIRLDCVIERFNFSSKLLFCSDV